MRERGGETERGREREKERETEGQRDSFPSGSLQRAGLGVEDHLNYLGL